MIDMVDPVRMEKFFAIRVEYVGDKVASFTSAHPEAKLDLKKIDEKLALLKVSPVNAKVDGVGWRRRDNILYLHIYESDLLV